MTLEIIGEKHHLIGSYEYASVTWESFRPFFVEHRADVFGGEFDLPVHEYMSKEEHDSLTSLRKNMEQVYRLAYVLFCGDKVVGWVFGYQESFERFYIVNAAIYESHRGRGQYRRLLNVILDELKESGFQEVTSKHKATKNEIIIPQLKSDFVITGFEVSDTFGLHIQLSYFFNKKRRRAIEMRVGMICPEDI